MTRLIGHKPQHASDASRADPNRRASSIDFHAPERIDWKNRKIEGASIRRPDRNVVPEHGRMRAIGASKGKGRDRAESAITLGASARHFEHELVETGGDAGILVRVHHGYRSGRINRATYGYWM